MRKKTLVTLFIVGSLLEILAFVFWIISIVTLSSNCSNGTCTSAPTSGIFLIFLAGICSLVGTVLLAISWIGVLNKQAQRQQWAWFVCTILFSYVTMIIYWIAVPESSTSTQGISYQPPVPGSL
ncbi:MAG: hypothetical protein ACXWPS_18675 [Ktedonobacteraceae bacterium]